MLYVVIAFLYIALLFYLLFGGADFGAGIIELFTSDAKKEKSRLLTYRAIGPIWEANHMWLIISIVILFVGFPAIYSSLSIYLHIPLSLMLLGIIARGTAFIFRHYDPVKGKLQKVYNLIYVYSSFVTPFFLGNIAGTVISGRINPAAKSFPEAYLFPWLGYFPIAVGLFTICICGFLAAVYLIGEADDYVDRILFRNKAIWLNILTVLTGGLIFLSAYVEEMELLNELLSNNVSLTALVLASISLPILWYAIRNFHYKMARVLAGFQVSMILFALFYRLFPAFVIMNGAVLTLEETAAPLSTLNALGIALLAGSIFILPALYYLIYSFQKKRFDQDTDIVNMVGGEERRK
ncbi:cytochrome d ubiquinol oxidase subunit II [Litoribacter populi]|uniref:cytochrome d ubiquinol oxidase subunit II n=1 Tax=Litoribacter populi TaxID=2598460 RepID=UPI00117D76D6|nr:cytochrome d ubiquinol oxidase subunit II [Litoribacter populi]